MPEPRSPFPARPDQEFLTIRISRLTAVNGLLAMIIVIVLAALGLRERAKSQTALASAPVASHSNEPAVVSAPSPASRPTAPRAEATAAERSTPAEPVESPEPNERAIISVDSRSPETDRVEIRASQVIYLEPPATDSLPAQPEVKPEDPPQPDNHPDPPAAASPRTSDPPPARPAAPSSPMMLNGAGATYPYPLYSKWFHDYHKLNPRVEINYQSVGSGAGIREFLEGVVDFGATDVPMSGAQLSQAKTPIVQIPTVLGAIVPVCNIPGVSREVMFTPELLAGIYLGRITSWGDPAIANVNRGRSFPDLPIVVIHRAEGNAATIVFTDYLSKVSRDWQENVGKGTSVKWPVGVGAKGNEGVAGLIHQTPGAIGYVDLLYAEQNHVPFGSVRNVAGNFVKANLHSVSEAADSVTELPPNIGISIANAAGKDAYPIASFTWFLVPKRSNEPAKGQDLAVFLDWIIDAGQPVAENLGYAPIPRKLAGQIKKMIAQLR